MGAHWGPYGGFFFDEGKNENFWPRMMLIKLNSQSFSLFQEPLQALLRHLGGQFGPFGAHLESLVTPSRPSGGSSKYNYGAPAKTFGPLGGTLRGPFGPLGVLLESSVAPSIPFEAH